jgi:spore germination cell wall hydrolase CwlJ-like protein
MMDRIWVAACVALVALAGCQQTNVDRAPERGATGAQVTERKVAALEQNASADGEKTVRSLSEIVAKPEAQAVDPAGKEPMDDAITCLARSIYWEARGEEADSTEAVASVVMNRLGHDGFPNTVCGVVKQGHEQGSCQFSWWCDGRPDHATDDASYATAKEIARRALNLQLADRTGGALYFHHRRVRPSWTAEYIKTVAIGEFIFYKPRGGDAK